MQPKCNNDDNEDEDEDEDEDSCVYDAP
ncbi:hypothetical protein M0804_014993 [Polistes exclamans]|nr:hypothetical protein M0804_014994 [Polistes exclamans]KAI4474150.1 hypothetical protein M0804_014993 [Polistes exclamans]